ncbi:MAG: gamma-glutamyltransferase [Myxococcales bacterium]|nr:gamma-glutamyltransferase [Myxococcales bacterium]
MSAEKTAPGAGPKAADRPGRNGLKARHRLAELAGQRALVDGGTAVDMVLAGALAAATLSSETALLGGGGIVVVGPGVGQYFIDGRARAPGLGVDRRPKHPSAVPDHWSVAVGGLLSAVIAAQARFGELSLMQLVQIALLTVGDEKPEPAVKARMRFLDRFGRIGIEALEREGLVRMSLDAAGPVVGGLLTEQDLRPVLTPVVELLPCTDGAQEVFVPPMGSGRKTVQTPPPVRDMAVESVVAADMHGVNAAMAWALPPAAVELPRESGFALPAMLPLAEKGVPRHRPGVSIPQPLPLAVLRESGRAWAACGVSGGGDVLGVRDRAVSERLAQGGVTLELGREPAKSAHGMVAWVERKALGDQIITSLK